MTSQKPRGSGSNTRKRDSTEEGFGIRRRTMESIRRTDLLHVDLDTLMQIFQNSKELLQEEEKRV